MGALKNTKIAKLFKISISKWNCYYQIVCIKFNQYLHFWNKKKAWGFILEKTVILFCP